MKFPKIFMLIGASVASIGALWAQAAQPAADPGTLTLTPVFKVTAATGDNLKGIKVALKNELFGIIYPEASLNAEGVAKISNVVNGETLVKIDATRFGLALFQETFDIESSDTIRITLQESVRQPFALQAQLEHDAMTGIDNLHLTWNKETDYFYDDFESYEPFAIEFSPWSGYDGDKETTAQISGTYPNSALPQYATIFNPLVIQPSLWDEYPVLRPNSGAQYVGIIRTASGAANNDWIISPRVKVGVDNIVQFMAKAADKTNEQFRVGISTTGTELSDFVMLTPGNYETVDYKQWTPITYSLSDYEGDSVYVAINCLSKAAFMLMIDDFYVGPKVASTVLLKANARMCMQPRRSAANPNESFDLYLDGVKVAHTDQTTYSFMKVAAGAHTLGVQALYRTTQTEQSSIMYNVPGAGNYALLKLHYYNNADESVYDAEVKVTDLENGVLYRPEFSNDIATFLSMPNGAYEVRAEMEGFNAFVDTVTLAGEERVVDIEQLEERRDPFGLRVKNIAHNAADGTYQAELEWNRELGFTDDFETYTPFTQQFGDYLTYDGDQKPCYKVSFNGKDVTFGAFGQYGNISAMVFNPAATTPAVSEDAYFCALSGSQFVAFMSPQGSKADDWLIAPKQAIGEAGVVRFFGRAYSASYPETIEVCVSTTYNPNNPERPINSPMPDPSNDFTVLGTVTLVNGDGAWSEYEVSLADYAGQRVYVALHYVSNDKWIAEIDDLYIGSKEGSGTVSVNRVQQYHLFVDGEPKATTDETSYIFTGLTNGEHTLGVQAEYASGLTQISTVSLNTAVGIEELQCPDAQPMYFDLYGRKVEKMNEGPLYLRAPMR